MLRQDIYSHLSLHHPLASNWAGSSLLCTRPRGPSYIPHQGFPDSPGQLPEEVHGHLQPEEELWGKGVDCDVFHVKTVSMQEVLNQICSTLFDYPMIRNCSELVKYINNCVNTAWGLSTMVGFKTLDNRQQVIIPHSDLYFHGYYHFTECI